MKLGLFVCMLLLTVNTVFANSICSSISQQNVNEIQDNNCSSTTEANLSASEFYSYLPEFEYDRCKDVMDATTVQINNTTITMVYSTEDNCDGGNTYGVILDQDGQIIADIADGDVYCR